MIAESITWDPLHLRLPPTWALSDMPPLIVHSDESFCPVTLNGTEPLSDETSISIISQRGTPSLVRILSPGDQPSERETSRLMLVSEINGYRDLLEPQTKGSWNIDAAIDDAVALVNAIPLAAPLPRPMLLSEQVAIYWDFGDTYAEIDFDGSSFFDAYAKRSGTPEVYLDHLPIVSTDGRVLFPNQIEKIVSSAKDVVVG
jgi:hypothetical protein